MASPLSRKTRLIYFFLLSTLFIIGVPFLILFTMGYRFGEEGGFEKRGGIYVSVTQTGADILINWDLRHQTQFLGRTYLQQNMSEGEHEVEVRHPEYKTWYRRVEVRPQTVTPLHPFLVPNEYDIREIVRPTTTPDGLPLDPKKDENSEYAYAERLFSVTQTATTTENIRQIDALLPDAIVEATATVTPENAVPGDFFDFQTLKTKDTTVWYDGATIYAYWHSSSNWLPERFCNIYTCSNPMQVVTHNEEIQNIAFYPGRDDVIIYTLSDGIYVAEIDKRPWPVRERIIYGVDGLDFRIDGGRLYIKEGDIFAQVTI